MRRHHRPLFSDDELQKAQNPSSQDVRNLPKKQPNVILQTNAERRRIFNNQRKEKLHTSTMNSEKFNTVHDRPLQSFADLKKLDKPGRSAVENRNDRKGVTLRRVSSGGFPVNNVQNGAEKSETLENEDFAGLSLESEVFEKEEPKHPSTVKIEADLGIGTVSNASSTEKVEETFLTKYAEVMRKMKAHTVMEAMKQRYVMFLPTAFQDSTLQETDLALLYGNFKVSDVRMHYDKNGNRLGSGTMRVFHDRINDVQKWVPNRAWKAQKMMNLRKRAMNTRAKCIVTIFLRNLSNLSDTMLESMLQTRFHVDQQKIQTFYDLNGESTRNTLAVMTYETAFHLEKTILERNKPDNFHKIIMLEIVTEFHE
uniref:Uncharacterized protein n=1 Tax=Caenorhabditis japonica TaxID=281687 RepID=A0A8R1DZ99_CAEJA